MKHFNTYLTAVLASMAMLSACATKRGGTITPAIPETAIPDTYTAPAPARLSGPKRAMPYAVLYRTDGDYNNRVSVSIDTLTGQLLSFPAVTDVSANDAPIVMADGWLLDRRGGIGPSTAFLNWTYAQYHALPATPSPQQILANIIPGARVTQAVQLRMTTFEAQADTAAVNAGIRSGLDSILRR